MFGHNIDDLTQRVAGLERIYCFIELRQFDVVADEPLHGRLPCEVHIGVPLDIGGRITRTHVGADQ
jgi:hypothetical protein